MDNLEPHSTSQPDLSQSRSDYEKLRQLVTSILLLVIVVSGTFTIYLALQVKYTRRDLEALRPQATNMIAQYEKAGPAMDEFVRKLTEYGRTHPDFAPIVTKYGLNKAPSAGAPPPASATPPGQKK